MTCIGCGLTAAPVVLALPDGIDVEGPPVCAWCLRDSERELAELRAQHRRLVLRGYPDASAMMSRRVDRYFRNGTLRPLKARAVA